MTSALAFLERILPVEGYKCALVIDHERKWNTFFPTVAELAQFISVQDGLGRTAYHACAAFGTPDSRKQSNAIGARSFWLDIDAGEGKPYASPVDAALAVHAFLGRAGLPPPIYVGSGYGLHVYWPLEEMVDAQAWHRYATGLKRLAHQHGLATDVTRTADIASVLRTPGTHNRKHVETKLVRGGDRVDPNVWENGRAIHYQRRSQHLRQRAQFHGASCSILPSNATPASHEWSPCRARLVCLSRSSRRLFGW